MHTPGLQRMVMAAVILAAAVAGLAATETVTYSYDAAGRLVTAVYRSGDTNAAIHYAYDLNGNRTNLISIAGNDGNVDTDGDGFADLDELRYFAHLAEAPGGDPDGDGLDNTNEVAFGSHPGMADTDGDGAGDREEWVADTDPANPVSRFAVTAVTISNAPPSVAVTFPSSATRAYTLKSRSNLTSGAWTPVPGQTGVPGNGATDTLTDTGSPQRRFYRVEVKKP